MSTNDDFRNHPGADGVYPSVAEGIAAAAEHAARLTECQSPSNKLRAGLCDHVSPEEPINQTVHQGPPDRRRSSDLKATPLIPAEEGPRVPGYRALRKLGAGTYGKVWLYEDERTSVRVAIKFFDHGTSEQWKMLQDEVKQLARLDGDPGIVELKDVEANAIPPYYVMRFAEQGSLAQRLEKSPLSVKEALIIFRQVAEALAYVHAKGIRHCDLKPGNVLLDSRGRALLGDFGQAHLCSDLTPALGTYFYMAPEQADLAHTIPDTRWDVYGLGALFYAMITGAPPREAPHIRDELANTVELPSRLQLYRDWVRQAATPTAHKKLPGMDKRLATIIDRCLAIDPSERFHDASAVLAALDRRHNARRRRPLLIVGLLAPLALLGVMGFNAFLLGHEALARSEQALVNQMKNSEQVTARLIANIVEEKLNERVRLLTGQAQGPELARAVMGDAPRERLRGLLQTFKQADPHHFFFKLTLADRQGRIVADEPQEPGSWDKNQRWCWRDWFNGQGNKFGHEAGWFEPVNRSHITQPYMAQGTATSNRRDSLTISISTPLRDPDDPTRVVALLVGSVHVDDLHSWIDGAGFSDGNCFASLYNERYHCLLHHDQELVRSRIQPGPQMSPIPVAGHLYGNMLRRGFSGAMEDFRDPIDGRHYIASYAPVRTFGWGVIVEHDREVALRPVQDLRSWMQFFGTLALSGLFLLTVGFWSWLIWTLRGQERAAMAH